ncbi:MAG: AEC family transporter, partial [Chthoniobacterales bacterium]
RFLGREFMADLNKLVFWVALPALIFVGVAQIGHAGEQTLKLIGILSITTVSLLVLGWIAGKLLKLPPAGVGTLAQAAFRGNLAYIGIPVLAYAFAALPHANRDIEMATALLVMTTMTAIFNVLAVIALQGAQHKLDADSAAMAVRNLVTNPLIIACVAGLAFTLTGLKLPVFLSRSLETLGASSVPVALLCIGGSLATVSMRGRRAAILTAAVLKVFAAPLIAWLLCWLLGISGPDTRIALVLAACPTAVASFVMAEKLSGDEALASGSIALSTVLSAVSLALVLYVS